MKTLNDGKCWYNAGIAPEGNVNRGTNNFRGETESCFYIAVRIFFLSNLKVSSRIYQRLILNLCFTLLLSITRCIYVTPPRQHPKKYFYWSLVTALYGLVNATTKIKMHSDNTFFGPCLKSVVHINCFMYSLKKIISSAYRQV